MAISKNLEPDNQWRAPKREAVAAISPEVAEGLFANSREGGLIAAGHQALTTLSEKKRQALWRAAFPGLAAEVELAWMKLDPQVIAKRDGGEDGHGVCFEFPVSEAEAGQHLMICLRKLLILTGPYPKAGLMELMAYPGALYSDEFDRPSGHCHDPDALGYLACAVLEASPDSELAVQLADLMEAQLLGQQSGQDDRGVCTAVFCAERPDLWQRIDGHLPKAGKEPEFLRRLLSSRAGGRPGALLHFLQTIRDHDLLRFEAVIDSVIRHFGVDWAWPSIRRDDFEPWFLGWLSQIEKAPSGMDKLPSEPGACLLALWAEAMHDGPLALSRIADPAKLETNQRLAAVHFLKCCPAGARQTVADGYVTDDDLRVANLATDLLFGFGRKLADEAQRRDQFKRFGDYLKALPKKPTLEAYPAPFPQAELNLSDIENVVARSFPDGSEDEIEALLPKLDAHARVAVVERLKRYTLSEDDRDLEKIIHGSDPDDWEVWLEDHEGEQSQAQRTLLLKMLGDRSPQVVEEVAEAIQGFVLSAAELDLLKPVLKGKSAAKRLAVTQLLATQPESSLANIIPQLMGSKLAGERLAALEVLRQLADDEATRDMAAKLFKEPSGQKLEEEEQRALEVLKKSIAPAEEEPPALHNALGLVDPRQLAKPVRPVEKKITLHSPVTIRLIEALDQWLADHADVMIPAQGPFGGLLSATATGEMQRLGDGKVPRAPHRLDANQEEQLACFPLAAELAEWWDQRPKALRDSDGFELIRLQLAIERLLDSQHPQQFTLRKVGFGVDQAPTPKAPTISMRNLVGWIIHLRPKAIRPDGWIEYLIDSLETVFVRLPDKQKNWAGPWGERVAKLLHDPDQVPRETWERIWSLARNHSHDRPAPIHLTIWDVLRLFQAGVVSEDELIWRLVGHRPFGDYDRERAFSDLRMVTAPSGSYGGHTDHPECQRVFARIAQRVLDLELGRGEEPEVWTYAAREIQTLHGAVHLQRLLSALGKTPMKRPSHSGGKGPNVSREAVLMSLVRACRPADDDTPEGFAALMQDAGIKAERLLEIAMLRTAWIPHVAHTLSVEGLRDAVGWIYAHSRSDDYQWLSTNDRDLWEGEVGFDSALSAQDFLDGEVDADWFRRAHDAVGPKIWKTLYQAAKFASSNNGHGRARLYSDALLGEVDAAELAKRIEDKGDLNAVRAIGLPELPKSDQAQQKELLKRYQQLQALRRAARQSKPQRRASQLAAFEVGVRNLARRAGHADTVRFEWAMEQEEVADLTEESMQATVDDLDLVLTIEADGKLVMQASRAGKALARIPAAAKKDESFKRLKQRMDELKEQAARLRPALEDLMIRGVCLPAQEWRNMLAHPLAGPLLSRLVLVDESGAAGLPTVEGLMNADAMVNDWPSSDTMLHLAHSTDLLPAESWHRWQTRLFDEQLVQPFKQVFRETYLPVGSELEESWAVSDRFKGAEIVPHKMLAILAKRGWVMHPDEGLYRNYRDQDLCAWLDFEEAYHRSSEQSKLTVTKVRFTRSGKQQKAVVPSEVCPRVFSETLRDVDLVVSVAHVGGAPPESGTSTIEIRSRLIEETCRMLKLDQVTLDERHARIEGELGNYRVHLGSGVVHREPGGMIAMTSEPQRERGRLFLPFVDDDPVGVDVLSRVLLFARDASIKDPHLAAQLRGE